MFDEKTKAVLEKAGWYDGRKIDISKKIANLEECGFEVFDKAKEFLQEFDQLKLEHTPPFYPKFDNIEPGYDEFDVDWFIDILLKKPEAERKEFIERRFTSSDSKEKNIPIGSLSAGEEYLFITESGKIVTDMILIGNSIEESVIHIINGGSYGFLDEKMRDIYGGKTKI